MGFVTFNIGDFEFFSFKLDANRIVAYNAHLKRYDFDHCPICCTRDLTDEHILLDSLNGKVLTRTCSHCNNTFGRKHEGGLAKARRGLRNGRIHVDGLPGDRKATIQTMFNRSTGQVDHTLDSCDTTAWDAIKQGAPWSIVSLDEFVSESSVRASLLKAAYLSRCVRFGEIPNTKRADDIRAELIKARNVKNADDYEPGPIASSLRYLWGYSYYPNKDHHINYHAAVVTDSGDAWIGVLLGGVAVVQHVLQPPAGLIPLSLGQWRSLASRAEILDPASS